MLARPNTSFFETPKKPKTMTEALDHTKKLEIFRGDKELGRGRLLQDTTFTVHTMGSLSTFINDLKTFIAQKNKSSFTLRYTITPDKIVYFAGENSYPNAMPHHRMTGNVTSEAKAIAAGNLRFIKRGDSLSLWHINNKSGDFRPDFNSVRWILAALIFNQDKLPFELAEELTIEEFSIHGGIEQNHKWSLSDAKKFVNENMKDEREALTTKQPQASIEHTYPAEVTSLKRKRQEPSPMLRFSSTPDDSSDNPNAYEL